MKGNLQHAIELTFGHEGGYSDNKADPGGPTKYGITLATLSAFRRKTCTAADVKALTLEEAAAILDTGYWRKIEGDKLPSGIDFALFDYAVNSGPGQAVKTLQRIVDTPRDGIMGPRTLAAVAARPVAPLIREVCDARLAFMQGLKTWSTFGKGWSARVAKVKEAALEMTSIAPERVAGATTPVTASPGSEASAKPAETAVSSTGQGKVNIAAIVGGVVAAVPQAVVTLTPYADRPWVHTVLPVLATVGLIGALAANAIGLKVQSDHIAGGSPQ
jgi:lysozyme family protein